MEYSSNIVHGAIVLIFATILIGFLLPTKASVIQTQSEGKIPYILCTAQKIKISHPVSSYSKKRRRSRPV